MSKSILCYLGIHRPLECYEKIDKVFDKTYYYAKCSCGIWWITDSLNKYFGFKIRSMDRFNWNLTK